MGKLVGTIDSNSKKEIPEGAVVAISVNDTSRMGAPATVLGRVEYSDKTSFPFDYEVDFDDEPVKNGATVSVSSRVERDGQLLFITDTRFLITNYETGDLLDRVDFHVISIN